MVALLERVIEVSGIVLILGILMGYVAIPFINSVNTSGWSTMNLTIWGAVVLLALSIVVVLLIQKFQES